jgi:hypothetical protein
LAQVGECLLLVVGDGKIHIYYALIIDIKVNYDFRTEIMNTSIEKSSLLSSFLKGQTIVYAGIVWAFLSLLFFLLFSVKLPDEDYPLWYSIGTYILEIVPFLTASLLCYRNWQSPQIASGRNVWLGIGLGMLFYSLGGMVYGWWELCWGMDPYVSPADLFYIAFYLMVGWGMLLAVLPRRLNLEVKQWTIVGVIAVVGAAISLWITVIIPASGEASLESSPSASLMKIESPILIASSNLDFNNQMPLLAQAKTPAPEVKEVPKTDAEARRPEWVDNLDAFLTNFGTPVNFFYIFADLILLIIATTLLLAFWGGRFSQSWRMIALATFCLYLADTWYKYTDAVVSASNAPYESGSLFEVLFIFSGVLFAIGAALEFDISSTTRTRGRRRRGSN